MNSLARSLTLVRAATSMSACVRMATAQQTSCAGDPQSDVEFVSVVSSLVTASDSVHAALRARVGLPAATAADVQKVTDELVCSRLLEAHNRLRARVSGQPFTRLAVVRVGTSRYVVFDGEANDESEFDEYQVYDDAYKPLGGWEG